MWTHTDELTLGGAPTCWSLCKTLLKTSTKYRAHRAPHTSARPVPNSALTAHPYARSARQAMQVLELCTRWPEATSPNPQIADILTHLDVRGLRYELRSITVFVPSPPHFYCVNRLPATQVDGHAVAAMFRVSNCVTAIGLPDELHGLWSSLVSREAVVGEQVVWDSILQGALFVSPPHRSTVYVCVCAALSSSRRWGVRSTGHVRMRTMMSHDGRIECLHAGVFQTSMYTLR